MDTFILAATSFTISVSLMITGRNDRLQSSFSRLCAAVFISQGAISIGNVFHFGFLQKISYLGTLAIAPLALGFFRYLTRTKSLISLRMFILFVLASSCAAVCVFTSLSNGVYFNAVITSYTFLLWYYVMRHCCGIQTNCRPVTKKAFGIFTFCMSCCSGSGLYAFVELLGIQFAGSKRHCFIGFALFYLADHCLSAAS